MKKAILVFAIICSAFTSIGQERFASKIGYTSIDNKGITSNITFTPSKKWVTVFGLQSDGPNLISISGGLNLKPNKENTKAFLMPGVSYDWQIRKFLYSGTFSIQKEEKNSEMFFVLKGIGGQYSKLITDGEVLLALPGNKNLRFGPYIVAEIKKEDIVYRQKTQFGDIVDDMTLTDYILSLGMKTKWQPYTSKKIYLSGFVGWQSMSSHGQFKNVYSGKNFDKKHKLALGIGLEYKF